MALESGDGRLRREGARKSWLVLLVQNSSSLFSMAYNAVHVSILRLWGKRFVMLRHPYIKKARCALASLGVRSRPTRAARGSLFFSLHNSGTAFFTNIYHF
jgi:hypothetical protein